MKLWFAVCAVLSGLLLGLLLATMQSCTQDYEIDAQGGLQKVDRIEQPGVAPQVQRRSASWASDLPVFQRVASSVRPGDKLIHTRTAVGWPLFALEKSQLKVLRNGVEVLTARDRHILFWTVTAGISILPLVFWGAGALWVLSSRPRKPILP